MLRMLASLLIAYAIISYMDAKINPEAAYKSLHTMTPYERCLANFGQSEQVSQCEVLSLAETF